MFELIDLHPAVAVEESEYQRLLGYPADYRLEGRSRELADWARGWYREHGRPWVYARQAARVEIDDGQLRIDGKEFASSQLHGRWSEAEAHTALLAAVSAGIACEEKARQLWQEGKPDEYFFLESFGSAVVEHLITTAGGRICAWAEPQGMAALPHYSPGYSGWDISDQVRLFELLRQPGPPGLPAEIRVLETGMLQPKKSLLAVIGLTRRLDKIQSLAHSVPCENCALPACQYRRVPYQYPLTQMEDVRRLQPGRLNGTAAAPKPAPKYTVNTRALKKWAQQRLQLQFLPDGCVQAQFRYEGTTCSNLGRPLEYDYHVKLGAGVSGEYRILETHCAPAPGDTGHAFMCEYLKNPQQLEESIAAERPLLGGELSDVLTWKREMSPAGCYCDAASRRHKWGLVFEVIHYALAQPQ